MSTLLSEARSSPLSGLARLRDHAAVVRALLDEFDRLAPVSPREAPVGRLACTIEQLQEEIERLGCRILECAAAMSTSPPLPAATTSVGPSRR